MKLYEIKGYEGLYSITRSGMVFSHITNKIIKQATPWKYPTVRFYINGKMITKKIHRLLAICFIPNPENKPCVNHKDGDKHNNKINNLEWVTYSENSKHAHLTGLQSNRGEKHSRSKLKESDVLNIRSSNDGILFLASKYGVHKKTIYDAINRKTWNHI